VGEDHGVQEADATSEGRRSQEGERTPHIDAKEDRAQSGNIDAVAQVKPVGDQSLHYKTAGERIDGKERCQFDDDGARVMYTQTALGHAVRMTSHLGPG